MDEKQKCEELKSILEGIKQALDLYNNLNSQEKLTITPQEQKKDMRNIFICVYNDNQVGLFEKRAYDTYGQAFDYSYNAWIIYVGLDSEYIGIQQTCSLKTPVNNWQKSGYKANIGKYYYTATCNMKSAISFEDMRLIMYNEGIIGPYELGKATSQEMIDVLKYAYNYYNSNQNISKQR